MDESRQCLTCLLLLTPIMFPDGNHFTFQSLLFSVFAKLLFAHSTRISSAVIIVVLLLGVTDFYPKFTFVLSSGGDRLDVRQEQENLRFLLHHCCLTVSSLQAVLASPVSCLLRTPEFASCRFSFVSSPRPRPPPSRGRINLFCAKPPLEKCVEPPLERCVECLLQNVINLSFLKPT